MFEPGSVMADIMQLSLIAGERLDDCGQWVDIAPPSVFQHKPFSGNGTYPGAAATIASVTVPESLILIVTYASVYLCQTDETVNSIDFGVNHNFFAWWQYQLSGVTTIVTSATGQGQGIINRPVLLVFPPTVTAQLMLLESASALTDGSRTIECTVTAYLAPESLRSYYSLMASQF